eukprot:6127084-Pleurochrysis_carterae.AAC.1
MSYSSLRAAAHVPPEDWDFAAAAWKCPRCPQSFVSRQQFESDVSRLSKLKEMVDEGEDKAVQR